MKGFGVVLSAVVAFSGMKAQAARIASGNAAELAAHRIEKLVLLKKLPASFQKNFKGLGVTEITPGGVNTPSFEVVGSQEADQGEVANAVSVILDENGKALSSTVAAGKPASQPTTWTDKDPLTLVELAVHHIEHKMSADSKLHPFYHGMTALQINQMKHGSHTMAVIEFLSNAGDSRLVMNLNTDGSLVDYTIQE